MYNKMARTYLIDDEYSDELYLCVLQQSDISIIINNIYDTHFATNQSFNDYSSDDYDYWHSGEPSGMLATIIYAHSTKIQKKQRPDNQSNETPNYIADYPTYYFPCSYLQTDMFGEYFDSEIFPDKVQSLVDNCGMQYPPNVAQLFIPKMLYPDHIYHLYDDGSNISIKNMALSNLDNNKETINDPPFSEPYNLLDAICNDVLDNKNFKLFQQRIDKLFEMYKGKFLIDVPVVKKLPPMEIQYLHDKI